MRKRILNLAIILIGAASLMSCGKMKEGSCFCTTTKGRDVVQVHEYYDISEQDCKQFEGTSTSSNGLTVTIKCDFQ